jgi:hypothetical protein
LVLVAAATTLVAFFLRSAVEVAVFFAFGAAAGLVALVALGALAVFVALAAGAFLGAALDDLTLVEALRG